MAEVPICEAYWQCGEDRGKRCQRRGVDVRAGRHVCSLHRAAFDNPVRLLPVSFDVVDATRAVPMGRPREGV